MQISDDFAINIISELFKVIENLQAQNADLRRLLAPRQHVSDEVRVEVPQYMNSIGHEPWPIMKARLEKKFTSVRQVVEETMEAGKDEEIN